MESPEYAWEEALKHEGLLDHTVGRYLRSLSPTLGLSFEDLKSYGWEGMLHAVEGFDPEHGTKWSTYAAACIRHRLDRAVRDRLGAGAKGRDTLPVLTSLEPALELPAPDPLPEHTKLPAEVEWAIEQLPTTQRLIVCLIYLEGLDDAEVSEALALSDDTVARFKRRALKRLKGMLV